MKENSYWLIISGLLVVLDKSWLFLSVLSENFKSLNCVVISKITQPVSSFLSSHYLPIWMLQFNYLEWASRKNDSIHMSEILIYRYYYHSYYGLINSLTGMLHWWCWKYGYCYHMEYLFQIRYHPQKLDFCSNFVCDCLLSWGKKIYAWFHVTTNDVCSNFVLCDKRINGYSINIRSSMDCLLAAAVKWYCNDFSTL